MAEVIRPIIQAGATGRLVDDFRILAEATAPSGEPKYAPRPVLVWLARFIAGHLSGPNRDAPIYELCHLVNAIDACGGGRDRRDRFFLGLERATPGVIRGHIDAALAVGGWRRSGFEETDRGISIHYLDGDFDIRFGRMPVLVALYEFLAGIEGPAGDDSLFYAELTEIFDDMVAEASRKTAIQTATNRISKIFRQYRRRYLASAEHEGKFDILYSYLKDTGQNDKISIDDGAVLDFWLTHSEDSERGDFRLYKTVFDGFVTLMSALEEASARESAAVARPIGADWEAGEIEPDDSANPLSALADWRSPLADLAEEPAASIKFLKKTEQEALALLMQFGPRATDLALSFLRLEVFGQVQAGITTDLQFKKGAETLRRRIACLGAEHYPARREDYGHQLDRLRRLQKAVLHVLMAAKTDETEISDKVVPLRAKDTAALFEDARRQTESDLADNGRLEAIAEEAAKAFRGISRKGFEEVTEHDDDRLEGFRMGAEVLLTMAGQLEAFLERIAAIDDSTPDLMGWFERDRGVFSDQFKQLYGAGQ